jgi:hypothetical protein
MKILSLISIVLLCSCNKDIVTPILPQHTITFTIDSALSSDGKKSLPKDNNGFYHLILSTTRTQTLTRITGTFLVDGKPNKIPSPVHGNIEWVGSHYWLLRAGESATAVVKTYFNPFTGQLQISQLSNLISQQDQVIPIVNGTSQLGFDDGSINTMAAPIYPMRGDTLTIIAKARYTIEIPVDNLFSKTKVDSIQKSIRIICD